MTVSRTIKIALAAVIAGVFGMEVGSVLPIPGLLSFVTTAEARVGRPLTPVSVAGVARRTTRRTIRRSTIYLAALPAGCARVTVYGTLVWRCGGTYYQSSGSGYVVVYVD